MIWDSSAVLNHGALIGYHGLRSCPSISGCVSEQESKGGKVSKPHSVVYDDGEVELLNLKTERWTLVSKSDVKAAEPEPPKVAPASPKKPAKVDKPQTKEAKKTASTKIKEPPAKKVAVEPKKDIKDKGKGPSGVQVEDHAARPVKKEAAGARLKPASTGASNKKAAVKGDKPAPVVSPEKPRKGNGTVDLTLTGELEAPRGLKRGRPSTENLTLEAPTYKVRGNPLRG
jgi:hypothetical protein